MGQLEDMQVFVRIVEAGSITKAAGLSYRAHHLEVLSARPQLPI